MEQRRGPKTLVRALPGLATNLGNKKLFATNSVALNDVPKAGQRWEISNIFFSFPFSTASGQTALEIVTEVEFWIEMFIGGALVAEQKILENRRKEEQAPFPAVGSLEPFVPAVVYAGQQVELTYNIQMGSTTAAISLLQGKLAMNYDLVMGR